MMKKKIALIQMDVAMAEPEKKLSPCFGVNEKSYG